jgi:hypothetical protein
MRRGALRPPDAPHGFAVCMHRFCHTLAVSLEFLNSVIPPATVFKLNIQMFGV